MGYVSERNVIEYIQSQRFLCFLNDIATELEVEEKIGRIKIKDGIPKVNSLASMSFEEHLKDISLNPLTIKNLVNEIYPAKMEVRKRIAIVQGVINFLIVHELVHLQQYTTGNHEKIQKLISKNDGEQSTDELEQEADQMAYEIMSQRDALSGAVANYMLEQRTGKFKELNSSERYEKCNEIFSTSLFEYLF